MNSISALHGVLGIALICCLVFAEEAGVPLPFAPGDLLLVVAGSLAAAGVVNGFVLVPCLLAASVAGALLGYTWSRAVGARRLASVARRLHVGRHLTRVERRVQRAGTGAIIGARLVPGLRVYTTLAAGAFEVPARTFARGLVVSVAIWVTLFTGLGMVAGEPVARLLVGIEHATTLAAVGAGVTVAAAGAVVLYRRASAFRRVAV